MPNPFTESPPKAEEIHPNIAVISTEPAYPVGRSSKEKFPE